MRFSRTRLLVGESGLERLRGASVAVFGLGGVGGYAVEAFARAGVGRLFLVDADRVEASNLNRQLLALENTIGRPKVEVARERIALINPDARVDVACTFIEPDNIDALIPDHIGYAVDAIDTLRSKTALLAALHRRGISMAACMGAAGKLALSAVHVDDISRTTHCPLARRIRIALRRWGIRSGVRCVYSSDPPLPAQPPEVPPDPGPAPRGVIAHVPGLIGLTAAGAIINDILANGQATTGGDRGDFRV